MPPRAWAQVAAIAACAMAVLLGIALGLASGRAPGTFAALLVLVLGGGGLLLWLYVPRVGRAPYRGPRGRGRIAFTFDDGPGPDGTAAILDVLRAASARATFFCLGQAAAAAPGLVRRIVDEGHGLGNHTFSHRKLTWLRRAEIARELDAAQVALQACGVPAPRWFRAPHGFKSVFLPRLLRERGLRPCAWTHGVWDSDAPGVDVIVRRARRHLRDGEILLLHDGGGDRRQTAAALAELLAECRQRRLQPVTLDELLGAGE